MLSLSNNSQITKVYDWAIYTLLFVLIPVWSIPHTMAIRNIAAGLLLILVIVRNRDWLTFLKESKALILFCIYLIFYLAFISTDFLETAKNINSEWLKFILYSLVGGSIGMWFANHSKNKLFFFLGLSFSAPLLIHLSLFTIESLNTQSIPWGYAGLSLSHGDLGYSALQGIIFLSVYLFFLSSTKLDKSYSLLLIILMVISVILARSRGGLIFAIFSFTIVSLSFILTTDRLCKRKKITTIVLMTLSLIIFAKITASTFSDRWQNLDLKVSIGLMGNALDIHCKGADGIRNELLIKGVRITEEIEDTLSDALTGTAARITTARAGISLLQNNPFGFNASRYGYQIGINKVCKPISEMSNTHNGWIDTALAIGVLGAFIFLIIYLTNIISALKVLSSSLKQDKSVACALFATSLVWLIRNILDTAQRDQMLEIQGFCMALLAGLLLRGRIPK
jgi:hypothetical protein